MSDIEPLKPISKQGYLPPAPKIDFPDFNSSDEESSKSLFNGGETEGLAHMSAYFASEKPMFYKEVRNAIDGWDNSCKLSPWLANGCLSAREAISVLSDYEKNITANESTYWIYFELLWREYFQCMHIKMVRNCFLLRVLRAQIR